MASRKNPKTSHSTTAYDVKPRKRAPQNLADLTLYTKANRIDGDFDLFWTAKFGEILIDADGKFYNVHYTAASLQLVMTHIEEVPGSTPFRQVLTKEIVKNEIKLRFGEETNVKAKASLSARFKSFISASAEVSADKKLTGSSNSTVTVNTEMVLIEAKPNMGWDIGHPVYGDVRKTGTFLSGPYGSNGKDEVPLTRLAIERGMTTKTLPTINATISIKQQNLSFLPEYFNSTGKQVESTEREICIGALKDRLRSVALMKAMDIGNNLILARTHLDFTPSSEDEI
jgi:hypothetical protein